MTRIVYENPKGRSTLEIFGNYEKALVRAGMTVIYTCQMAGCGAASARSAWNRFNGLFAAADGDPRYLAGKIVKGPATTYVALMVGRARTQLDIVEIAAMQDNLVVADAGALGQGLDRDGKVSVYGIHFDTDKADVKPESKPALDEIAKLLRERPTLTLFVVGHTDMTGDRTHNQALSEARARAIVQALVKDYGIAAARLEGYGVGPLVPAGLERRPLPAGPRIGGSTLAPGGLSPCYQASRHGRCSRYEGREGSCASASPRSESATGIRCTTRPISVMPSTCPTWIWSGSTTPARRSPRSGPPRSAIRRCSRTTGRCWRALRPDFVIALGRHRHMAETAHHLLDERYPFLMEKPMGVSAAEVRSVADKAAATNAFVAVPLGQRYLPSVVAARQLIAEGRLGPLSHFYFRLNRPTSARYSAWDSPWMLDPAEAGGGCLRNLGPHGLDLFLTLTGEDAQVTGAQLSWRALGQPVEDYASVLLRYVRRRPRDDRGRQHVSAQRHRRGMEDRRPRRHLPGRRRRPGAPDHRAG